ncbi:MAG: CinA family protein [Thermodesulfovibrionia bacterium]|nr:CinA family protein [Thermodesulfovibrionia bacterium]
MKQEHLDVVQRVHKLFKDKGLSLAVAESCTGGLISHLITALPGASRFFQAGVVSYSEEAKKEILHVSSKTISQFGMVSEETAVVMADGVRSILNSDYALSTTGNLGPDVLDGKAKGLVFIAVCRKDKAVTQELHLEGDREENKEEAALSALRFLAEIVENDG